MRASERGSCVAATTPRQDAGPVSPTDAAAAAAADAAATCIVINDADAMHASA